MNKIKKILIALILSTFVTISNAQESKELLFYIGITMVKPVNELAKNFEKTNNCKIKILQGGSQDLYDSIAMSQKGDLYLPGSSSYRDKHLGDGFLLEGKFVGYNRLSLVVKKGNPKKIKPSLDELTRDDLRVVLGNATSGSIGNATKKILLKYGNYQEAILNTIYLAPDSRNLTKALINSKADVVLNWHATTFWNANKKYVEALALEDKYSKKSKLVFNLLSTSKNKDLTKKFMEYAASKKGREIFHKYGFLNKEELKNFEKVTF